MNNNPKEVILIFREVFEQTRFCGNGKIGKNRHGSNYLWNVKMQRRKEAPKPFTPSRLCVKEQVCSHYFRANRYNFRLGTGDKGVVVTSIPSPLPSVKICKDAFSRAMYHAEKYITKTREIIKGIGKLQNRKTVQIWLEFVPKVTQQGVLCCRNGSIYGLLLTC